MNTRADNSYLGTIPTSFSEMQDTSRFAMPLFPPDALSQFDTLSQHRPGPPSEIADTHSQYSQLSFPSANALSFTQADRLRMLMGPVGMLASGLSSAPSTSGRRVDYNPLGLHLDDYKSQMDDTSTIFNGTVDGFDTRSQVGSEILNTRVTRF
jgi:hypothetical protein